MWYLVAFRLVVSMALSAVVGFERETHSKPAGLRTYMLVSVGCTAFVLFAISSPRLFGGDVKIDPARIAAQIITGVGFLGAGTIIRGVGSVHGLTTAASIWTVAAIGTAAGAGFYEGAVLATAAAFGILRVGSWRLFGARGKHIVTIVVEHTAAGAAASALDSVIAERAGSLHSVSRDAGVNRSRVELSLWLTDKERERLVADLAGVEGVTTLQVG